MDETRLNDAIDRADTARRIMADVRDYFTAIEAEYGEQLMACEPGDDLGRYRLVEAIKVVRNVAGHLKIQIEMGKLSRKELGDLKSGKRPFF
ncbi:hypothetical protein [Varunaivibrio sulfuroxidans]|uniref:Uncharacterized protein n=1 Tax=Varunaivibrio sulfuroxidans TaxID=1773489 RepID=A0A4R3JAM1_9PROT|nr:hypothetical protein [Varunaivibrio sulfuroxidans]TCS61700.1 hypothetical protein EDD55_107109 [Varunaivibrio sulfuroxidans]WES32116.1 hypothetical protein P3M64_07090 [Varunaivibrio sulfuroxidans]